MKIEEFFDKGYYLNLDRRVDRRIHIEEQLSNLNLTNFVQRISAEDGTGYDPNTELLNHHLCGKSHHNIYDLARQNNASTVVIFEDDFVLYENGLQHIESGLDTLKTIDDWDIVYFGGYCFDKEVIKVSENLLKADEILTTHGYGISSSGMNKLDKHIPFKDSLIDGWIRDKPFFNSYLIYPFSCYQLENPSDIDKYGNTPNLEHWKMHYLRENPTFI